mmetsp:Transcript_43136/g.93935  ORF Transcript_43136/g.93935 Transcript_43136/m.93935 type:complete len:204 (-) Transcript_43136:266-877(-)
MLASKTCSVTVSDQTDVLQIPAISQHLEASVAGLVVVAKTARAALHLHDQPLKYTYHALVQGRENFPEGWVVQRSAPSLRFGSISEVVCEAAADAATFRKGCVESGHTILGDCVYGGDQAPMVRRRALYLQVSAVSFTHPSTKEVTPVALPTATVEKYDKLFAKEAYVWEMSARGTGGSDYVQKCKEKWDEQYAAQEADDQPA